MCTRILYYLLGILFICSTVTSQSLVLPEVVKKHVKKIHSHCVTQTGATEELIHQAHNGDPPNDRIFKCFVHCIFDRFALIDSDNVVHLDVVLEVAPEEIHYKIKELIDACGEQKGVDGCDTAYQAVLCYLKADRQFVTSIVRVLFE